MLQAYALQQTVLSLGHECEIINFRTRRQRNLYRPYVTQPSLRLLMRSLRYPNATINDIKKHRLFEKFLNRQLSLSQQEYSTLSQLAAARLPYKAIISGSDQIWNTNCFDHDRAYFLPFASESCRKIAYAPSMGPCPDEQVDHKFDADIRADLKSYHAISVRETHTADRIGQIIGRRPVTALDPTLLLTSGQWEEISGEQPLIKSRYIMLYTPWYDENLYHEALRLSGRFSLPVVVTNEYAIRWIHRNGFRLFNAVGPTEFLNLISNAQLVVSGSFHAAVFSILFDRQLYAFEGMADARVSNLLSLTGLQHFAKAPESIMTAVAVAELCSSGRQRLVHPRMQSIEFLANALSDT